MAYDSVPVDKILVSSTKEPGDPSDTANKTHTEKPKEQVSAEPSTSSRTRYDYLNDLKVCVYLQSPLTVRSAKRP